MPGITKILGCVASEEVLMGGREGGDAAPCGAQGDSPMSCLYRRALKLGTFNTKSSRQVEVSHLRLHVPAGEAVRLCRQTQAGIVEIGCVGLIRCSHRLLLNQPAA